MYDKAWIMVVCNHAAINVLVLSMKDVENVKEKMHKLFLILELML